MKVFANNFRGFKSIELDLQKLTFLIGDNSSGKSSLLHLADSVLKSGLNYAPRLSDDMGVGYYDYFSPYFRYANVTFGYFLDNDDGTVCKVITVEKRKDNSPRIKKCTYLIANTLITVARRGSTIYTRLKHDLTINSVADAVAQHDDDTGLRKKGRQPKGMTLGDPAIIMALFNYKEIAPQEGDENSNFWDKLFGQELPSPRLVSPLRAMPEQYYSPTRRLNSHGLHFAPMLRDFFQAPDAAQWASVERFGKESKLFDKIVARKMSTRIPDAPLVVSVGRNNKEFLLTQVGVGVSQVVPVIMETLLALGQDVDVKVLFQQPELHLHPIAQSALGSFLFRSAAVGLRGIIETHSSYLIDRIRAEIRDANLSDVPGFSQEDMDILFCENLPDGNFATRIGVSETGKLIGEPEVYHSFFVEELLRTMF